MVVANIYNRSPINQEIVLLISIVKGAFRTWMEMTEREVITKEDLDTLTPKEIFAQHGIDLDKLKKTVITAAVIQTKSPPIVGVPALSS